VWTCIPALVRSWLANYTDESNHAGTALLRCQGLSNDESHGSLQRLGLTEFTTPATPPFACMGAHLRIPLSTDVRFLTVYRQPFIQQWSGPPEPMVELGNRRTCEPRAANAGVSFWR
jgi:hypothetical protein